jgi:hypothetical protein
MVEILLDEHYRCAARHVVGAMLAPSSIDSSHEIAGRRASASSR